MKKMNKKGFTIVELVIVIAVIAILAAVLIPTFISLVDKANRSADQQAVRQMNTALAIDGAVVPTDIFKLHEVLSELGMTSEDYHPLTKDTYFFWDSDLNRVLHVDKDYKVIAPAEYAGQTYVAGTSNWYSLSLEIAAVAPENFNGNANTVTVSTGSEMQYVLNALAEGKVGKGTETYTVNLDGTIDMMGAAFELPNFKENANYNIAITGGTIKNATAVDYAQEAISDKAGQDGVYYCALIPSVSNGNTVTLKDIVIENMSVKNTNASNVAFLIGSVQGKTAVANLANITIKNSTIIGHRNTGALVGLVGTNGTLNISGKIELNNVDVKTVGGRSGMLIGYGYANVNVDPATDITLTDCSYGIYECAQNTGSETVYNEDKKIEEKVNLGLQSNGQLYSYATALVDSKYVNQLETKYYVENALYMSASTTGNTTDFYGVAVKGWNK